MDISVVIPLYNEEDSLNELFLWIKRVMEENNFSYEVIFINDGSTDNSWNIIEELGSKYPEAKGIKFRFSMEMTFCITSRIYLVSKSAMVKWLSLWTLTFKIVRKKSLNFIK